MAGKSRSRVRKSHSRARRHNNNPKSKEACKARHMAWIGKHKSKSARGKRVMVRGSCRRKSNRRM